MSSGEATIVPLRSAPPDGPSARPILELCGFRRVHLEPGECRTVAFALSTEQVAHTDAGYRRVVEPGTVSVRVGRSSADLALRAELTLVGPVIELVERHTYVTAATIE